MICQRLIVPKKSVINASFFSKISLDHKNKNINAIILIIRVGILKPKIFINKAIK